MEFPRCSPHTPPCVSFSVEANSSPPKYTAKAQQSATEQEAYAIGVDAHLYFYSLVTMDIMRKGLDSVCTLLGGRRTIKAAGIPL
jgi:hypothetical protein